MRANPCVTTICSPEAPTNVFKFLCNFRPFWAFQCVVHVCCILILSTILLFIPSGYLCFFQIDSRALTRVSQAFSSWSSERFSSFFVSISYRVSTCTLRLHRYFEKELGFPVFHAKTRSLTRVLQAFFGKCLRTVSICFRPISRVSSVLPTDRSGVVLFTQYLFLTKNLCISASASE